MWMNNVDLLLFIACSTVVRKCSQKEATSVKSSSLQTCVGGVVVWY